MKLGLIGALGGLGKGLHELGTDIARRREQALAAAQAMAAEQRKAAERKEEKATDRTHDLATIDRQAGYKAEESAADRAARRAELLEKRTYDVADREDSQSHDLTRDDKKAAEERALVKLRGDVDERNTRLKEQLDDKEVQGVQYGDAHPSKPGYQRIIIVRKDGKLVHTTSWADRTKKDDEDEPSSATTLPLPTARR